MLAAKHEEGDRNSLKVLLAVLHAQSLSDCCCEEPTFAIGSCGNITDDPLIVIDRCDCSVIPKAAVKFTDRPSTVTSPIPLNNMLSADAVMLDVLETLFVTTFVPRKVCSAVGMSNCTLLLLTCNASLCLLCTDSEANAFINTSCLATIS